MNPVQHVRPRVWALNPTAGSFMTATDGCEFADTIMAVEHAGQD